MILACSKHRKGHSHQKMGPERDLTEGRQRTEETDRQSRIVEDMIKLNIYMIELVSGSRE
jgi:hypothetical protein